MQNNIIFWNEIIPLFISKSIKRKSTISFKVTYEWLNIKIPFLYDITCLDKLIEKKKKWVFDSWLNQKSKILKKEKEYVSWESFLYKGKSYKLKVIKWDYKEVKLEFKYSKFIAYIPETFNENDKVKFVELEFKKWYLNKSKEIIEKEAKMLSKKYNFKLNDIYIKSYKSKYWQCRWNDIFLNYSIIKLDIWIIRHIILHELCHIVHKNHSKDFWNLLSIVDKDYKKNKNFLKNIDSCV